MKTPCHLLISNLIAALCALSTNSGHSQSLTLADALDAPALTWTTGGNATWSGQTNTTFDGVDAAQSGVIGNSQESWLQTTVTGPGELTFRWKVSSESGYDFLGFYVNGVLQSGRISGNVDWQQRTYSLGEGVHVLRWRYAKDGSDSSGQDRGWVDLVSFPPPSGPAIIVTQPQSQAVFEGSLVTFNVIASGAPPMAYQWFKVPTTLAGATNSSLTITNVQSSHEGSYTVMVANTLGSVTSAPAILTVSPAPITFLNPTPASGQRFGSAVAAVGSDRVLVGDYGQSTAAFYGGAAYLFSTNGMLLTTFTNPTPADFDFFGSAVAAVGDDLVLIGAEGDDSGAESAGAAYLFSASGSLLTTFTNPTPATHDSFGHALAAVGGDRVLIADRHDNTGANAAGAAYLFTTSGTLLTTITNPSPAVEEWFGNSVALVGTDRIIIGAPLNDTGANYAGAVHLFTTNGMWLTTITNPTPAFDEMFGSAVAAVGSDRVLIGAPYDNTGATDAGAAYLFSVNGTLLTTFTNPTPAADDQFGAAVAAVGDDRVIIGAMMDNTGASDAGSAYLFSTNGTLLITFTNLTPASFDLFGMAVTAVGSDRVLIGTSEAGEAYLFTLPGETTQPPMLTIGPAGTGQIRISWATNTAGFVLQETWSLSPANWTNSSSGTDNSIPATGPSKFYRLFKP
ncbi:MAG: immunoglobulin domain-containing protein [Verrucomicrobia bacterium]|nr:immunoglobulin domain-containing protein [Verrucomicrobiota bacterium]